MARWCNLVPFLGRGPVTQLRPRIEPCAPVPGWLTALALSLVPAAPLVARQATYSAPMLTNLPSLSVLESPDNSVVRFYTNLGIFDLELFETVAPITVENFKKYVNEGRYDGMFFHRKIDEATSGIGVLQGGGFTFTNEDGHTQIETFDPIVNEFNRPNAAGTIAMAKFSGQPNSATSQFFINLQPNPELNNPANSGGFTVFGRLIKGFQTVQKIGTLHTEDLDLPLTGFNSNPGVFDTVPVTADASGPGGPTEDTLVIVYDAEIIKGEGVPAYYDEAVYYPEGWRGPTITERVDLSNSTGSKNYYQIIVRYESGGRDEVIASGFVEARGHRTVKICDPAVPSLDIVRSGVGYAIEVRSTHPLSAALNHRDFGVTIAESFVRAEDMGDTWLMNWTFAHGEEGPSFFSYLVLQNLSHRDADVTVTVHLSSGAPKTFNLGVDPFRRGGMNLGAPGVLPPGRYSVQVTSSVPIVAALSVYERVGSGLTGTSNGSTAVGTVAGGRTEGFLAAARIPTGGSSFLSFLHSAPSPSAIIVDVFFYLQNGTTVTAANPVLLTSSSRRADRNLGSFGVALPIDQYFSVGYKVRNNAAAISATYVSEHAGDTLSTPFTTVSNGVLHFADGFVAGPAGGAYEETISIFNPYARAQVEFGYRVVFRFTDGTTIQGAAGTLGPLGRIDIKPHLIPTVMAKINSQPVNKFYSVSVETAQAVNRVGFVGAAVAQITRVHAQPTWRQTMTSGPTLDEAFPLIFMNHFQFDP